MVYKTNTTRNEYIEQAKNVIAQFLNCTIVKRETEFKCRKDTCELEYRIVKNIDTITLSVFLEFADTFANVRIETELVNEERTGKTDILIADKDNILY